MGASNESFEIWAQLKLVSQTENNCVYERIPGTLYKE